MGEDRYGGAGRDNVLWEGPRVVDDDVAHVGQEKEQQRETQLGPQDGRATPPQFTAMQHKY